MWLRSLDCFMQKGQDESVDSAEMISVPFGLRQKKHCRAVQECYFDIQIIQVQLIQRLMLPGVPTTERFSKTSCVGKLVVHNHLTSHYFFWSARQSWLKGRVYSWNFWNHWCILRSLCHIMTSNYDELRLRRGSYSKLGASRCQMVISCFTWV